jgi:hypothetical protein
MKNIGFMAVSGLVSAIVAAFLSGAPGMQSWIVFVGTVAAIAGSAVGIPAHKARAGWKVLFVLVAVVVCVCAVIGYRRVLAGEPGSVAASFLLIWTAAIFGPVGFLIELGGLKLADQPKDG